MIIQARLAFLALLALFLIAPPTHSSDLSIPVKYKVSGNTTISLGILSPTFDDLPTPNLVNLTVTVSNCTTDQSTTCVALAGANVEVNVTAPERNQTIAFDNQGDGNYTYSFFFYKVNIFFN